MNDIVKVTLPDGSQKEAPRGTTVLVATHDRDLIRRMQRRTIVLTHGQAAEAEPRS